MSGTAFAESGFLDGVGSGVSLARNSVYNLLGQGVPLVAALVAIPRLIRGLGTDRFGVLTIAWMVIGYFSLFDFGLGRALTQVVAERIGTVRNAVAPVLVGPALMLMFVLGLVGTLVTSLIAPWLVNSVLKIPTSLRGETLVAFYLLAAAIPTVVVTAGLAGLLSAFERFGVINAIRAALGIFTFVAPLGVLPFSQSLIWVTGVLVVGRISACVAYFWAGWDLIPRAPPGVRHYYNEVRPLFRFGAWMTVSNLIGPLLLYLDRFIIGAVVSVAAVAYYATPYEMATKLLVVPGAVIAVLFPAFAASYRQDQARLVHLYVRGTKYIALLLFPVLLLMVGFAHEGLRWWLGDEFARISTPVLQVLAIGVFINSLAQVVFTLVQGIGRPDLTAKLHLMESVVYIPLLWWAIHRFGIVGAATVWTARVALDGALLSWVSSRFLGESGRVLRRLGFGVAIALAALCLPLAITSTVPRFLLVSLILATYAYVSWFILLTTGERASILTSFDRGKKNRLTTVVR